MQPHTLLKKAILKAERNGFDLCAWWEEYMESPEPDSLEKVVQELMQHHNWEKLVFAPRFAQSLWGADDLCDDREESVWAQRLSSMVAADPTQRIRYLEHFLGDARTS